MALFKVCISLLLVVFAVIGSVSAAEESESKEFVVTLDHSNFTDFVAKHKFIVVEFYAPWYVCVFLTYSTFYSLIVCNLDILCFCFDFVP